MACRRSNRSTQAMMMVRSMLRESGIGLHGSGVVDWYDVVALLSGLGETFFSTWLSRLLGLCLRRRKHIPTAEKDKRGKSKQEHRRAQRRGAEHRFQQYL